MRLMEYTERAGRSLITQRLCVLIRGRVHRAVREVIVDDLIYPLESGAFLGISVVRV